MIASVPEDLLVLNRIAQKVPGGIPSENLFLCLLRIKIKRKNDCRLTFSLVKFINEATAILLSACLLFQIFR